MSERLGRYTLVRSLAMGGMAEVFHAKTEGPGGFEKDVALKRVLPHLQAGDGQGTFAELFLDEARIAARLTHPNVVQVFDFGEVDGSYFLAMELLDGVDLAAVMRASKKSGVDVPLDVAVHCISEAASGLHYAHTLADQDGTPLRLVHRDVSPSNVFVTRHGEVKVLDFGIAKAEGQLHVTNAGVLKGKHAYVPPEQIHGQEITPQADIWALGLTLHELICGVRFFDRKNQLGSLRAILEEELPAPSSLRSDVPQMLDQIVLRCVNKELDQRYQSAAEVRAELQDLLGSTAGRDMMAEYVRWVSDFLAGKSAGDAAPQGLSSLSRRPQRAPTGEVPAAPSAPAELEALSLEDPDSVERGVHGTLDQLGVAELVQMIEMGKKSATVEVQPKGQPPGRLEIEDGQVLFAVYGAREGEEAFFELCRAKSGTFHLLYHRPSGKKNVSSPTGFLILEAMRRLDETGAQKDALDDIDVQIPTDAMERESKTDVPEPITMTALLASANEALDAVEAPPAVPASTRTVSLGDLADAPFTPPPAPSLHDSFVLPAENEMTAEALEAAFDVGVAASTTTSSQAGKDAHSTPLTGTDARALEAVLETEKAGPQTLASVLSQAEWLPVPLVVLIARDVLRAIDASWGEVRISTKTVILDSDGRVTLSREHDDDSDHHRAANESPEEAAGRGVDVRSRLFSVGTLVVEMLTGKNPLLRENAEKTRVALRQGVRPLFLLEAAAAPPLLASAVEKMWRVEPERRPERAADVLSTLEPLALRLEQIYPGVLGRLRHDPVATRRALSAEQARRDVAGARELSSGTAEDRRRAGYALMRARAACPEDGRAGARLLRLAQEEGWFLSGAPSSRITELEKTLAQTPDQVEVLRELWSEALDEGRFLHAAAALVRYTALRPGDEESLAKLVELTGDAAAPFGVASVTTTAPSELAPAPSEARPDAVAAAPSGGEQEGPATAPVEPQKREAPADAREPLNITPLPRTATGARIDATALKRSSSSRRGLVLAATALAIAAVGALAFLQLPAVEEEQQDEPKSPALATVPKQAQKTVARKPRGDGQRAALEETMQRLFADDTSVLIRQLTAIIEMGPSTRVANEARFALAQAHLRAGDAAGAEAAYAGVLAHTKPEDDDHHRAERLLESLKQEAQPSAGKKAPRR